MELTKFNKPPKNLTSLSYFSFTFVVLSLFFIFSNSLNASESFANAEESQLYQQGIDHRKDRRFGEAIECFKPLAEKNYVKAQHNLAFCLFRIGQDMKGYRWARKASNLGFQPSKNDLEKMNLMDLLLPIEMMTRVVSYFSREDIARFNLVSRRASKAVRESVTGTNFLTSRKPYAVQFRSLFSKIQFEPQPNALRFCLEAKVEEGSLEVHFRDTKHLKRIVEETPLMEVEDRLYFVQDSKTQDDKELVATGGVVRSQYVIFFTADTPLKVSGELFRNLTYNIRFPLGSDISDLKITNQRKVAYGGLTTYHSACILQRAIETFDDQLLKTKTLEAFNLLKNRRESRTRSPRAFPEFQTICPDSVLITAAKLSINQSDYIAAREPLIYMASSIPNILELQGKIPTFAHPIFYINSKCAQSGVYCGEPLEVQKGFEISTGGDLTVSGRMESPDHHLKINVGGLLWIITNQLPAFDEISIKAIGDIVFESIDRRIEMKKKPEKMSAADWQKLLQFWKTTGRI